MVDETSEEDKTEPASPRRLEKAREEGQVARSRELTTFLLLAIGLGALWGMGAALYGRFGQVMEQAFLFERAQAFQADAMLDRALLFSQQSLLNLLPFFMAAAVTALVSPMLLGGLLVSGKSLVPQFSRLNPMKGLKRIFSVQALAEFAKVLAKAAAFGTVLTFFLQAKLPEFIALLELPLERALLSALQLLITTCGLLVLALFVVVLIDVPYQLWHHAKQLRMSKEELKREYKEADGDPMVKSRIRAQQQAMARRRMMANVPTADVIITNPTHYAVALRYDESRSGAPRLVAKGADEVARRIRELGAESGVPLLEAPPLARALYRHVDLDQEIPAQLYTAVAEVLAWVFSLRRAREEGGVAVAAPANLQVPESMSEWPSP